MALITTISHFTFPPVDLSVDSTNPLLTSSIQKFEPEYLKKILGIELYDLFVAGLDQGTTKYKELRDGKNYTDLQGITQKWEGFTAGNNPIANYIFCKYLRAAQQVVTTNGVKSGTTDNLAAQSSVNRFVAAWNEMVDFNYKLNDFLISNEATYPEYIGFTQPILYRMSRPYYTNQELFVYTNVLGI